MSQNTREFSDVIREISKIHKVPLEIKLTNRYGVVDSVLYLDGYEENTFIYRIFSKYHYTVHGNSPNYKAIDFSGGPMLMDDSELGNLSITKIIPPYIYLKKI